MKKRPRRLRKNQWIRDAVCETHLTPSNLVYPVFITEKNSEKSSIAALPGQFRWGVDALSEVIDRVSEAGVFGVALFPAIDEEKKDSTGSYGQAAGGLVPSAIEKIKSVNSDIQVITDIALDPYSSDGHDGVVRDGQILNDETVELLAKMAKLHAHAGADWVAPSDMMDGRVAAIRKALDEEGKTETGIISYTAKYASAFYGPFRDALKSEPRFGDKKTYQMDFRNQSEALRELMLDVEEGADVVMVKPGLPYLDVIRRFKENSEVPIAAYQVSGEYAMIEATSQVLDRDAILFETLVSLRRAGADLIFTYHALDASRLLLKEK